MRLRLADDREGAHLWLTAAERADHRAVDLEAELGTLRAELERLRERRER